MFHTGIISVAIHPFLEFLVIPASLGVVAFFAVVLLQVIIDMEHF